MILLMGVFVVCVCVCECVCICVSLPACGTWYVDHHVDRNITIMHLQAMKYFSKLPPTAKQHDCLLQRNASDFYSFFFLSFFGPYLLLAIYITTQKWNDFMHLSYLVSTIIHLI